MHAIRRSVPYAMLLAAAIYLFSLTWQFEFPRVPGRVGPDLWPQILLALLVLACLGGIVKSLLPSRPADSERAQAKRPEPEEAEAPSRYILVAGGVLLFLAYPLALEYLGFLIATVLLMALFMLIGQWRHLIGVVSVSILGTLALFYIFRGVVYISLPLGTGPFQTFTLSVAGLLGMR